MVDLSTPLGLNGSPYLETSLISMNELAGTPVPTPQQEYVFLEENDGKAKADQVRR